MAFTKNSGRGSVQIASIQLGFADLTSGSVMEVIDMPSGTVIDDIYLSLDETFNPTTSAVIEVGTSDSTAQFIASQNIFTGQTLGGRAGLSTAKGCKFSAPGAITAKYTSGGGTATQGKLRVKVLYHYANQSDYYVET